MPCKPGSNDWCSGERYGHRWWTGAYLKRQYWDVSQLLATPADFPGMVASDSWRWLVRDFYAKVSAARTWDDLEEREREEWRVKARRWDAYLNREGK